jgi:hypothetical protein
MDQTRSYEGATRQEAWERFQADSREAAAHGWAPADQSWQEVANGSHRLDVTYRSQAADAKAALLANLSSKPPKRSRRRWILAGVGVLFVLAVASTAGGNGPGPAPASDVAAVVPQAPQPESVAPTAKETPAPTRRPTPQPAEPTDAPTAEPTPDPTAPPQPATMALGVGLNDDVTLGQEVARIRTGRLVAWVAQLNEPVGSEALRLVVVDDSGATRYSVALSFNPDLKTVGSEEDLSDLGAGQYTLELQKAGRVIATGNFEYVTPPPTEPPPPPPPAPANDCHPSYTGACLDPASPDYDCAGGSGDGPDYTGRVRVVGPDEYGLDRDGNGIGCE